MFDREAQLRDIHRFIEKMPSLTTTVGKVMEICSRQDSSPNELNRVISLDPVLTGQVLKLTNSAYYSLMNKVTSLTRAIIMLGINTVKNLALSTVIIQCVGQSEKSKVLPIRDFWAHSIGVGVVAKLLAADRGVPISQREEYFVAGLLHDLGKIPYGDDYINVVRRAKNGRLELIGVEKLLLGVDHQEIGGFIAEKWKLNPAVTSAIVHHHDPAEAEEEHRDFSALIGLADCYVNLFDIGSAGNPFPDEERFVQALSISGLRWEEVAGLSDSVSEEIKKAEVFLQV